MTFENQYVSEDEENVEGEVDLKGKLISVLDDLKARRKIFKKLSKLKEQSEESEKIIIILKTQLEEVKNIEEMFNKELEGNSKIRERLEA